MKNRSVVSLLKINPILLFFGMIMLSISCAQPVGDAKRIKSKGYGDGAFAISGESPESSATGTESWATSAQGAPLSYGNKGEQVTRLQRQLLDLGLDLGVTSQMGFYGSGTALAVRSLQRYKNIENKAIDEKCNKISDKYLAANGIFDKALGEYIDSFSSGKLNHPLLVECFAREQESSQTSNEVDSDNIKRENNATNATGISSSSPTGSGTPSSPSDAVGTPTSGNGVPPFPTNGSSPDTQTNGSSSPSGSGNSDPSNPNNDSSTSPTSPGHATQGSSQPGQNGGVSQNK